MRYADAHAVVFLLNILVGPVSVWGGLNYEADLGYGTTSLKFGTESCRCLSDVRDYGFLCMLHESMLNVAPLVSRTF